jgi:D-sedoheptulose 7-phosphate isomerase
MASRIRCFERSLAEHQDVFESIGRLGDAIDNAITLAADSLRAGGKILLCGNGGSAADSQHIAAELVGRFVTERVPLAALALTTDSSILTAVANDYSYDQVFARQVRACGRPGDCLIGYSTSGNSDNVLEAFRVAKTLGLATIALIGSDGGRLKGLADVEIIVPSSTTSRIQEAHGFIGHALCEGIEHALGLVDA